MAKSLLRSCFAAATLFSSIALAVPIDVPAPDGLDDPINSGPGNTPLTIPYIFAMPAPGELDDPVNVGPGSTPLTIPYWALQSPQADVGEFSAADFSPSAVHTVQVPEPQPIFLFGIALLGAGLLSRRSSMVPARRAVSSGLRHGCSARRVPPPARCEAM
jgi:hypothetical protein